MNRVEMIIPPLFRCPISLDLLQDPVTLSTGQTYDRCYIEKWLAAGNLTCPVTMQKLRDCSMVPNHTLRHLIHQWLLCSKSSTQFFRADLIDTDVSIVEIKKIIESHESTLVDKLQALEKVQSLSQELPFKNSCLITLDFFGLLLEIAFREVESSSFVEKALSCGLELMRFSDLGNLNVLKLESKYERFLFLFEQGSVVIKKSLCLLVEAISSSPETRELFEKLGKSNKLFREIVHLIRDENENETIEAGVRALSSLSLTEEINRENLVKEGAVEGLVSYLSRVETRKRSLAPMAMGAIDNLLVVERAKEVIVNYPCAVKAIVKMVFRVSDHEGSESAVNSLLILCSGSKSVMEKAIVDGVLTQLLLLLQSQCSGRIKSKARLLLKLLRSNDDDENRAL